MGGMINLLKKAPLKYELVVRKIFISWPKAMDASLMYCSTAHRETLQ
jgi:hypothetical protein